MVGKVEVERCSFVVIVLDDPFLVVIGSGEIIIRSGAFPGDTQVIVARYTGAGHFVQLRVDVSDSPP